MTDRQHAAQLAAALRALVGASDEFVRDTEMRHGDAITDATEKARPTLAAWERHTRATEQQLPLEGL